MIPQDAKFDITIKYKGRNNSLFIPSAPTAVLQWLVEAMAQSEAFAMRITRAEA